MKLAYFTSGEITFSETFIIDLVQGLSQKLELTIISGKKEFSSHIIDDQIPAGYIQNAGTIPYYAFRLGAFKGDYGYKLQGKIKKYYADKSLKKINKEFDVAYIDYATTAVLVMDYLTDKKIPFVVHVHGYDITSSVNDPYYKEQLKLLFKKASYFIAASKYMKRLLILLGCPEQKIRIIKYGINGSIITPKTWNERLKTEPRIIFLGRLTYKKHPIALLHAFRIVKDKIPKAQLTIIGDGELYDEVTERIKMLNLKGHVKMLGALPREKSFKILNNSWIYAQHSVTALSGDQEGYAISPAEAALHELPVVSTYHNGIPEHVINGKTGYLVKEYDFETMASRIIELIEDPELMENMGKAGRQNILNLNNPEKRIESILELLKETSHIKDSKNINDQ